MNATTSDRRLHIIKTGSTYPDTLRRLGDFDKWMADALAAVDVPLAVVDAEHGAELPAFDACAGILITGSHAMVTDRLPWSLRLEGWLRELLDERIPIFAVCYGHQLLAQAAGGRVDYHPDGKEIGTVDIHTLPDSADDPLFGSAPAVFRAHATHSQSVRQLPEGAVRLAYSEHEANHAFRLGDCAWGVQFHPEYDVTMMREYIDGQAADLIAAGRDPQRISDAVVETPYALQIMRRFARLAAQRAIA